VATRVGTCLDRYEIDAELGRGAMGVVYRARDPKLGRTVAIKTVSIAGLDPDAEQEYRKRFVVEAHAAGRLSHPGIVTIFDVREDTEPYLVMEYVEGQSLQQLVGRENCILPVSTTLRLVQELAEALHYAHAQGVVHRDVKPANILVTPDGHPKIADFGIAKLNQTELTLPGHILGSPAFMAPEQLSEENVDSRSDLFSLGVILYYMLTGHRPFQGNSTTTVCFKLVNHEPMPVSALDSKFPPELDAIVSRAIAKDPAQRYQSGMAMASDLQKLREQSGFVHSGDWTERSLKRDAIPRYVKGTSAEPDSQERKSPAKAAAGHGFFQKEKNLFSAALVFGLLVMALTGAAFWSLHGSTPKPAGTIAESQQPVVEIPNSSDSPDTSDTKPANDEERTSSSSKKEQTSSKASGSKSKHSISQVKAPPATAVKAPTPAPKAAAVAAPADAMLQIEIEHHFTNATASVWVDDGLVYTQSLAGDKKRHALLFRKVVGHQFQVVRVASGKHLVRVRIQSDADSYDQSKISSVAFTPGVSLLRIVCDDKGDGLQLEFKKDGYQ
jgi:serine/threonine protein kinase